MQRLFSLLVAVLVALPAIAGCGPRLSERELGQVEYEVPAILADEAKKAPGDVGLSLGLEHTRETAKGGVSPK